MKHLIRNIVNKNNDINIQFKFKNKIISIIILTVHPFSRTKFISKTFDNLILIFKVTRVDK